MNKDNRVDLDLLFLEIAALIAKRSTCIRLSVGAIIVSEDNRIISSGWNGVKSGEIHCNQIFNKKDLLKEDFLKIHKEFSKNEIHAEENAILYCNNKELLKTSKIYVTISPCEKCAQKIYECGIKRVYFNSLYDNDKELKGIKFLISKNIEVYWGKDLLNKYF